MALTCEIMKVDKIFLVYENNGKIFNSYAEAYNYSRRFTNKCIYYVFTPTMQRFKRVCEVEKACRDYFKGVTGFEYYNIFTNEGCQQLSLLKEV